MKILIIAFLISLFTLSLTSCSDSSDETKTRKNGVSSTSKETPLVINGHKLPPEPDEALNNSTLLGIDSNNNGVRDDVERKIYFQYARPIEQVYMMQEATWYSQTIEDPVDAAKSGELENEHWNSEVCEGYLRNYKKVPLGVQTVTFMEEAYFNTKERMRAYIKFNEAMSGGVYHIPLLRDYNESGCDFNVTKMLEMEK